MSWDDLYWSSRNDTDLRATHGTTSTGSKRSAEITGYHYLFGTDQEAREQPTGGANTARVWYCC